MSVTLVSPRLAVQKGDFLGSGIPYWPLELAILAAFLQERGEDVSVLDLFGASPTTLEEREDHYLQGKPFSCFAALPAVASADVFIAYALSCMAHAELLSIVSEIRRLRPGATVAVLENTQAVTAYSLLHAASDFFRAGASGLLCGDIYGQWDRIALWLADPQRGPPPSNVLVAGQTTGTAVRQRTPGRLAQPIPAWHLFPLERYWALPYSHGPKTRRYLPLLTSRGCPYNCDFCVAPETNCRNWRGRDPEEVVAEMIFLRREYGVRHFQIEDLNPTVDGHRWERICHLLLEKQAGVSFYFVSGTKAETIKIEQVPILAKAGCRYLSISPESGSPAVLRAMRKSFDHEHGLRLIDACRRHGIYTQACLLVGHPDETPADHKLSCEYLKAMVAAGLDEVAVFVIAPLAGSALSQDRRIGMEPTQLLASFSPRGRIHWQRLAGQRGDLIRTFFLAKLKRGPGIWLQGVRAVLGIPRTKMENLPRRILFIYRLILRYRLDERRKGHAA